MKKKSGFNGESTFAAEDTNEFDAETIADEDELANSDLSAAKPAVESGVSAVAEQVKDTAKQALDQGQQVASQAIDKAKDSVKSQLSTQKEKAVSTLGNFTDALHETGNQLRHNGQGIFGDYADSLAGQVDHAVGYLRENDIDDLTAQVEDFARKQPALFIGGAFVLGVALARFLKSSQTGGSSSYKANGNGASSFTVPPVPTPASAGALTTTHGESSAARGRLDQFSDDALPDHAPITAHGYVAGIGITGNDSGK